MSTGLELQSVNERTTWDAYVQSMPEPHILQSWDWAETKLQTGWQARRFIWREAAPLAAQRGDGGVGWAAAALLVRRLNPRLRFGVAYAPKGPLLDWSDETLRGQVLRDLEAVGRTAGALFVKIDPDVRRDDATGQAVVAHLRRRGWIPSAEQIQYRNTVVSDLTPSEEELLAAMKPKWRYNIRLAERKGVTVREGSTLDSRTFYDMYEETGRRDGFLVRPFEYYRAIWESFMQNGLAHMLLAEIDGRPVAGLILFRFGPTAWYFYGASRVEGRDFMPNHALQWAALRWAKAQGCTRYDWWGAPDELAERDPMWGVYRFKQGFGGEFTPHIGAWDYPVHKRLYWAYTRAMPKMLALMRRRHGKTADGSQGETR